MSSPAARPARPEPRDAARAAACFAVHARSEPGVMPRVLELFAKRGIVPSSWHSAVGGENECELTIDIQVRGMAVEQADYIAACLRQVAYVEAVLTSRKW
jgi:acetolactate synthase small subunit